MRQLASCSMPKPNFLVQPIAGAAPDQGVTYLLDANVWIIILQPPSALKGPEQPYISFFEAITTLASNPRCKNKPRIYINALIVSEVVNALLKIHLKIYNSGIRDDIGSKEYRKTQDYKNQFARIKSDFSAYEEYMDVASDVPMHPFDTLREVPETSNYNDHYYYKIARARNLVLVTNDSDFAYPEVSILTNRTELLRLSTLAP
jgi:hypothetical protein